jgi:hypothetical protein
MAGEAGWLQPVVLRSAAIRENVMRGREGWLAVGGRR